jgi:hypothetical protein
MYQLIKMREGNICKIHLQFSVFASHIKSSHLHQSTWSKLIGKCIRSHLYIYIVLHNILIMKNSCFYNKKLFNVQANNTIYLSKIVESLCGYIHTFNTELQFLMTDLNHSMWYTKKNQLFFEIFRYLFWIF